MHRHEFLRKLHEVYEPRTYFEIGINDGRSLALSRVPTVAVDPAFKVVKELRCDLHMVRVTSDDFFKRERPLEHLGGARVDLAFIDGMHLFEYVLRDFINTEKYADWSSVIVFDDQLPRSIDEAARNRHSLAWTGDVYKIIPVLQRYRPDLRLAVMDTQPTGVLVVLGLDPTSTVLSEKYDEIMDTYLLKDPQQIPPELVSRTAAMQPETLFEAPFWSSLVTSRDAAAGSYGRDELVAEIDKTFDGVPRPQLGEWLPDPRVGRDKEIVHTGPAKPTPSRGGRPKAAVASAAKQLPASDIFGKLARRAPFLRRLPGASGLVRKLR
ncbi:MAG TPA: class I SAM-dependent methyltransferase [Actinopolymorphaceae bacterium]|nr:class I SAM-dependent methyltransferase [Actinopolymorphaceae bacterium]